MRTAPAHRTADLPREVVAGIDEAGRGPWAGPVVAAAVILDRGHIPSGLDDSKRVSASRREDLYRALARGADVGIGIGTVDEIDELNILQATFLAMRRAVENMTARPGLALVDGDKAPRLPCPVKTIIKGDQKCPSIAAASIVAKVTRDRLMTELASEYPNYGWERNKGYGTKEHQQALVRYGVTPHHRRSFRPIHKMLCEEKS